MKKIFSFICFLCLILCISCADSNEPSKTHYTISFHILSDSITTLTKEYEENEQITKERITEEILLNQTPTKEGYTSDYEWYTQEQSEEKVVFPYTVTQNAEFYLHWKGIEASSYSVQFFIQQELLKTTQVDKDQMVELPTVPQKTGHSFKGWSVKENEFEKFNETTPITENLKLYAFYEKNEYVVSYYEGSQLLKEEKIKYNEKIEDTFIPVKEGHEFKGWYEDSNYKTLFDLTSSITQNINLYAQFEKEKYNISKEDIQIKNNVSSDGYVKDKIIDFKSYENTSAYRKVTTADELIDAIIDAKYHYKNVWDDTTNTYTQVPADGFTQETFEGKVKVIEIMNDLNLGYFKLSSKAKNSGIVDDFAKKLNNLKDYLSMSDMFLENGISQIKIENTSNLLIFSKNGSKLTHCGFKLTSDDNVVFRNLEFDEIWQWEDAPISSSSKIGDYDWWGWAYFKISFCGYIWIDHCTFGKSYDGQIDYSNPNYTANAGVAFRAPYGADGKNGLHISWCEFNAGSDDPNGYLYQMMQKIEQEYQEGKTNYLYYNALRDGGISFEDILYGLAIPQKKGFLFGDTGNNTTDYEYNLDLQASFSNCVFKNIEDRLPKLRGGNIYMYNCLVDSLQYMTYRTKLRSQSAVSKVTKINSGWKCALVSQGILCGNGGSIQAESCIFKGIETLLKNNDSNASPKVDGGYKLINCQYQRTETSPLSTTGFPNASANILKESNFKWHTEDGLAPFSVSAYSLKELEEILTNENYGVGVHSSIEFDLLISKYA